MNDFREEHSPYCYFHPKELIVGICALCLRERLLNLASRQGHLPISKEYSWISFGVLRRRPKITFPKVFALGSFLHRLEPQHRRPDDISDEGSIASLEDSFISIKFEGNGQASWESEKKGSVVGPPTAKGGSGSVVEHAHPRGTLRWHKRIGQLLQLARWKRSNKAAAGHVGIAGKAEGGRGWIRSLTRGRTTG